MPAPGAAHVREEARIRTASDTGPTRLPGASAVVVELLRKARHVPASWYEDPGAPPGPTEVRETRQYIRYTLEGSGSDVD